MPEHPDDAPADVAREFEALARELGDAYRRVERLLEGPLPSEVSDDLADLRDRLFLDKAIADNFALHQRLR